MEYLSKLFGSPARVKLLRLFIFNPDEVFDREMVVKSARITPETASKEFSFLARAGIIKRKTFYKNVIRPGSKVSKKRKTIGWIVNKKYIYLKELSDFMHKILSVSDTEMRKRFNGAGSIKLLVLSGFLINGKDGLVDILIVGDRIKEKFVKKAIDLLEAEFGQEIKYMILETEEYKYRRRVRDKFIRDVMDFENKKIINRLHE